MAAGAHMRVVLACAGNFPDIPDIPDGKLQARSGPEMSGMSGLFSRGRVTSTA